MSNLKDRLKAPKVPDLRKFSFENLAYLLRHRERWPENFEWDYCSPSHCALGLAAEVWSVNVEQKANNLRINPRKLFFVEADLRPHHVANRIDRELAKLSNRR